MVHGVRVLLRLQGEGSLADIVDPILARDGDVRAVLARQMVRRAELEARLVGVHLHEPATAWVNHSGDQLHPVWRNVHAEMVVEAAQRTCGHLVEPLAQTDQAGEVVRGGAHAHQLPGGQELLVHVHYLLGLDHQHVLIERIPARAVSGQIEEAVVRDVHRRGGLRPRLDPHPKAARLVEREVDVGGQLARIALVPIWRDVLQGDTVLVHPYHVPDDAVEAHEPAVLVMPIPQVSTHTDLLAAELEAPVCCTIGHPANGGSKEVLLVTVVACHVVVAQAHVLQLSVEVGNLQGLDYGTHRQDRHRHAALCDQREAPDTVSLLRHRVDGDAEHVFDHSHHLGSPDFCQIPRGGLLKFCIALLWRRA